MHAATTHPNRRTTLPVPDDTGRGRLSGDGTSRMAMGGDDGYTLALVALLMIPMIVMVSFAVDLGAWYAQSSKMQRASDAASMAGVVWLPNTDNAKAAADAALKANGFDPNTFKPTYTTIGNTDYQVTLKAPVTRFFSQVIGLKNFDMTRASTARFNKAIPLGSPTNKFGNDVSDSAVCPYNQPTQTSPCGPQPMVWSAINGPYQAFAQGDPYSTKCARNGTSTANGTPASCDDTTVANGAKNTLYKPAGYKYAIDIGAADIGRPMTVQLYDFGDYPRSTGNLNTTRNITCGKVTNGSNVVSRANTNGCSGTFADTDIGSAISGTGIPANTKITAVNTTNNTATMSANASSTQSNQTYTITTPTNVDCPTDQSPFNTYASMSSQNCQTGDSGAMNMEAQLYANDGVDLSTSTDNPLTACKLTVPKETSTFTSAATYKNKWVSLCTFTPGVNDKGIFPLTVKSSTISGITDDGDGNNAFAIRVTGGSSTTSSRTYALDDLSIYTNVPQSSAKFYLAEIGSENAGKTLILDLYDAGDGKGTSDFSMQVKAPPSGAPSVVPTSGTVIPDASGPSQLVTACNYNSTASDTKGPDTPQSSSTCDITTKSGSTAIYDASWLRIKIKIASTYKCTTDCWWTIEYKFGTGGVPTDRTVWSISVVGDPVHLIK